VKAALLVVLGGASAGCLIGARGLFFVGRVAGDLWRERKGKEALK